MSAVYRGSSFFRASRRSAKSSHVCTRCAARYFHHQQPLQQDDKKASSEPQAGQTKPTTRRQGAQVARNVIQGLRASGPGASGSKTTTPGTAKSERAHSPSIGSAAKEGNTAPSPVIARRREPASRPRKQKQESSEAVKTSDTPVQANPQTPAPRSAGIAGSLQECTDPAADRETAQMSNDIPLAQRFLKGKLVRFADEDERQRVLKLAQKQAKKRAENEAEIAFTPLPKVHMEELGKKAIAGKYETVQGEQGKTPQQRIMSHLKTTMQLNGSYSPSQQQAMLGLMDRMWPAQKQAQKARK